MVNIAANEAIVNVTWAGNNGDLRDPVSFDSTDEQVRAWVTEAVRDGGVANIATDPNANFTDFVIDRYASSEETPYNRIFLRPKTPFGNGEGKTYSFGGYMTISQALRYASQLKGKISDARERAKSSLTHKAGAPAPFSFDDQIKIADDLTDELAALQGKLAEANATNTVDYKGTQISLAHAVRVLQELKGKTAWFKELSCLAADRVESEERSWDEMTDKYISKTVATICGMTQAQRAARVDSLQEEFSSLNGAVESANHTVKLTV